jgi:iron complex outermembrane receptor protein
MVKCKSNRTSLKWLLLGGVVFAGPCLAQASGPRTPTLAETGAGQENAPSAHDTKLEEVVVTARRREERLLDVPVAASALGPQ